MPPRTTTIDAQLAVMIKNRREALGLSIEEAANRAGIGVKTWYRYESAGSIRNDKVKGVCRALGWTVLPLDRDGVNDDSNEYAWIESIDEKHEAWSPVLCEVFGRPAAVSFALGSDFVYDLLSQDLLELQEMPKGSHIGQLGSSWIVDYMPKQFLMRYDYEFIYRLRAALYDFRQRLHYGRDCYAHTVAEELLVRVIRDNAFDAVDEWLKSKEVDACGEDVDGEPISESGDWDEWPENLCGDDDFSMFLDNRRWIPEGDEYHFDRWFIPQFYVK